MNKSILKIAHLDKEFTVEQSSEHYFLLKIKDLHRVEEYTFQTNVIELAAIRNYCSKMLDEHRRLKREREKRTNQKEINLDR